MRERRQSEASNSARHQEQEACVARCLAWSQPQEQAQTRLAVDVPVDAETISAQPVPKI